jgi:hypothetical protein
MKKLLIILPILLFFTACNATTNQPNDPTPIHWKTLTSFSGKNNQISETFTVSKDWKIIWTCDPNSNKDGIYNIIIYKHKTPVIKNNDVPQADVNQICASGSTTDETDETGAGSYYLEINSGGSWTITIQEPA